MKKTLAVTLALIIGGCATASNQSTNRAEFCQEVHDDHSRSLDTLIPLFDSCLAASRCPTNAMLKKHNTIATIAVSCVKLGYRGKDYKRNMAKSAVLVAKIERLSSYIQ